MLVFEASRAAHDVPPLQGMLRFFLRYVGIACAFWVFVGLSAPALADPVLTVQLEDKASGAVQERTLTLQDLAQLPTQIVETSTIWTEGPQRFEGVQLSDLLQHLEVESGKLTLMAINEYSVSADIEEFSPGDALLAYRLNGAEMSARDKGPFWLIWNYDSAAKFRTEMFYALSIWQMVTIRISHD